MRTSVTDNSQQYVHRQDLGCLQELQRGRGEQVMGGEVPQLFNSRIERAREVVAAVPGCSRWASR